MDEQLAYDLTLSGTVVGVTLRQWTKQLADRLGITGWVQNNTDRTVSVHVEGRREPVESFIEQLRRPPLEKAVVQDVQVRDAEHHGYSDFSIDY